MKTLAIDPHNKIGIQENLVIIFKMLDISTTVPIR